MIVLTFNYKDGSKTITPAEVEDSDLSVAISGECVTFFPQGLNIYLWRQKQMQQSRPKKYTLAGTVLPSNRHDTIHLRFSHSIQASRYLSMYLQYTCHPTLPLLYEDIARQKTLFFYLVGLSYLWVVYKTEPTNCELPHKLIGSASMRLAL